MTHANILVTGGAGFIGSNLAVALKGRHPAARVTALDSLRRRGSELNLPRLRAAGVAFVHGDIRNPEDLAPPKDPYDLLVECSAEPSALAGYDGDVRFVVNTNLAGTVNCLELARVCKADVLFLSTSRVYPVGRLNALPVRETESRFELLDGDTPGAGRGGVAEGFPLDGYRTLYGATKLASELLVAEYRHMFGLRAVINRCGVIAGPWQMGKVDQGVFTLWVLAHHFGRPLQYIGFGGTGKQVRDLLHVEDLTDLLDAQLGRFDALDGRTFNVGGGPASSLSLVETTALCERIVGRTIPVGSVLDTREGDVRVYVTDNTAVTAATGWAPRRGPAEILADIHTWVAAHEPAVRQAFG
ncbi:MAG TPA: NAD-dependent epimerase/dehydratase family protein [Fimbriiglobus sp.]|nr:NAD-dependent epimerase/dehydratase family protein [Fimbriiglobus sp.]